MLSYMYGAPKHNPYQTVVMTSLPDDCHEFMTSKKILKKKKEEEKSNFQSSDSNLGHTDARPMLY